MFLHVNKYSNALSNLVTFLVHLIVIASLLPLNSVVSTNNNFTQRNPVSLYQRLMVAISYACMCHLLIRDVAPVIVSSHISS